MPHTPDPAKPELYPHIYWLGSCSACDRCYIDRRNRRCIYGGPFNASLVLDPTAFREA